MGPVLHRIAAYIIAIAIISIGSIIPATIDYTAQVIFAGARNDCIRVSEIVGPDSLEFTTIVFWIIHATTKIAVNLWPYVILAFIVVVGVNNIACYLGKLICSISFVRNGNSSLFSTLRSFDYTFRSAQREFIITGVGVVLSLSIVVCLNFYFHFGALREWYTPNIRASSTAGLVFVFFPIYASWAVVIIFLILISVGLLWEYFARKRKKRADN